MDYWSRSEPEALKDPENVKKLRETTLEELINRELLYQEGVKAKIKVRERDIDNGIAEIRQRFAPENARELAEGDAQAKAEAALKKQLQSEGVTMAQFRERLSKQIMARKLIEEEVRGRLEPPKDEVIKAYFEKIVAFINSKSSETPKGMDEEAGMAFRHIAGQVQAMSSERVRVSRILVKISPNAAENEKKRALKTAQEFHKKVVDGAATFSEVARAESEDPESASRGGDIGYVLRGVAPPEFEKAVFSLDVGEVSEPILTDIGYHIVRISEKRAAEPPEFERFKEELGKFMNSMEFQQKLEDYVQGLKKRPGNLIERTPQAAQSASGAVPAGKP